MVLAQRHSHAPAEALQQAISQIQPARVLGIAGAIALNVAALMLLLVPVSAPIPVAAPERIVIVDLPKPKPETPPPPIVEIVKKPQPTRTPQPQRQVIPQPVIAPPPVIFENANTMSIPVPETTGNPDPGPPQPVGPQISESLQYASAPAPTYPHRAMMDNREGTVMLKVLVDVDGTPVSVEIQHSSGYRELDEAARRQVLRKWKFRPAMRDGQAIQVYGIVPVRFSLNPQ